MVGVMDELNLGVWVWHRGLSLSLRLVREGEPYTQLCFGIEETDSRLSRLGHIGVHEQSSYSIKSNVAF